MPLIYHEGYSLGDGAGNNQLLKDTVGWTGKNLLKNTATSQTVRGVTFTVNSDGSVTANGTATGGNASLTNWGITLTLPAGKYIFSGCPSGGGANTYALLMQDDPYTQNIFDYGDGVVIDISETKTFHPYFGYVREGVTVNNLTFYPMLRRADILDDTYEPYHESVETMYEEEIHGVNLLKNIATSRTVNGVTFTVNADGSVTANGTATAFAGFTIANHSNKDSFNYEDYIGETLILSGCPANGSMSSYKLRYNRVSSDYYDDYGEGLHIVPDANYVNSWFIEIAISSGVTVNNLVFKPMLRKADIEDSTYRPYNPQAIQNQLNAQGVLGAKNLCPITANTQTINGVTYTVNKDSDGSVLNVTVNGTATATSVFLLSTRKYAEKNYILSGCPKGGNQGTTYALQIRDTNNNTIIADEGNGGSRALSSDTDYRAVIRIGNGYTANNLVFYPMLRLASDPDDTYQPYAMTNRELTEEKINIADLKTVVSASSDFADFKTRIASL